MEIETKRKLLGDLKQFAKAEMARDLATRHGKSMRLPWDEDAVLEAPTEQEPELDLDADALQQIAQGFGG